jgi:septal ring factor EnvC (AmiA/AmiB activator)
MLDHLIDPDIPTKRQDLEHDLREKCEEISRYENAIASLQDTLHCAKNELDVLRAAFWRLEPDPDRDR